MAVALHAMFVLIFVSGIHGIEWGEGKLRKSDPCRAYESCTLCGFALLFDCFFLRSYFLLYEGAACTNAHYQQVYLSAEKQLWPHRRPTCIWCPVDMMCYSKSEQDSVCLDIDTNFSMSIPYEYDCPLGPTPYPKDPPWLLPDWMGALLEAASLESTTLVDLSLPGTHDTLTYDLSLTVSDDGLDDYQKLAQLLHVLSGKLLPGELEEFFRLQAKTQHLTVTQQLDNGIRYLDIRIMMENDSREWYSIHFMQSKQRANAYLQEIRDWLDLHPLEIVVLSLSKHGDTSATGDAQYPDVSPEDKAKWWHEYLSIFDGLLLDTRVSSIYTTSVADLLRRNHRVVTFASDYVEFTGESPFALDGARIQNYCHGSGVFDEVQTMEYHLQYFQNATVNNKAVNSQSGFTLMCMNTEGPPWQIVDAAKNRFVHWNEEEAKGWFTSCASKAHIPGMTKWCPETLLDIAQLTSFYNHIAIEDAWKRMQTDDNVAFPNAFYLDALDYDGTTRSGTQLLDGLERSNSCADHKVEKYAYVDTVLAYNLRRACESSRPAILSTRVLGISGRHTCESLKQTIDLRRAKYPLKVWDDPYFGRQSDWPLV